MPIIFKLRRDIILPKIPAGGNEREILRWRQDLLKVLEDFSQRISSDLAAVSDHTALSNLNSATYYHLTQANHTDLTDGGNTTLHKHDIYILHSLATAANDFLVSSGAGVFVKKTLNEVLTLLETIDGTGSGLDADLLDTYHETAFALLAGRAGGQILYGDTAIGGSLTLGSTSNGVKGIVYLGTQAMYDELNNRLGIGVVPLYGLDINSTARIIGVTLIGATALVADFPAAKTISSQGDSGQTDAQNIGLVGEAAADGSLEGYGVWGCGSTNGARKGIGIYGRAYVQNGADTADARGGSFHSTTSRGGVSKNIGVYASAINAAAGYNYSFYGDDGVLHNDENIETAAQFKSTLATGTKPIDVTSTTVCTNLNADTVDGKHDTDIILKSLLTEQGDIIIASAVSTPAALVHGNAGDPLISGGHGANPSWGTKTNYFNPPGQIMAFAGISAPTGWLLCNGASVSRTTYLALFSTLYSVKGVCTISNGTPAIITFNGHGFLGGERIFFTTNASLPTGITANLQYWVTKIDANTFKLSTTWANYIAGTFVNTSSAGSGIHSLIYAPWGVPDVNNFYLPDLCGISLFGAGTHGANNTDGIMKDANAVAFTGRLGVQNNDKIQGHLHGLNLGDTPGGTAKIMAGLITNVANNSIAHQSSCTIQADGTNGTPRTGAETNPARVGISYIIKT